jgi:hypothetical protein
LNKEHPITPPPDLVQQWWDGTHGALYEFKAVTTQAARWGADQELEACCEWQNTFNYPNAGNLLRAARRPKPPNLKKLAYDALDTYIYGEPNPKDKERTYNTIRRALESLPD